jgi:hypothetical protein
MYTGSCGMLPHWKQNRIHTAEFTPNPGRPRLPRQASLLHCFAAELRAITATPRPLRPGRCRRRARPLAGIRCPRHRARQAGPGPPASPLHSEEQNAIAYQSRVWVEPGGPSCVAVGAAAPGGIRAALGLGRGRAARRLALPRAGRGLGRRRVLLIGLLPGLRPA